MVEAPWVNRRFTGSPRRGPWGSNFFEGLFMYIYTETATALDPLHPSRARPGVTYARTRALLSWPGAHWFSSDRMSSILIKILDVQYVPGTREGLFLFLIEGICSRTVRTAIVALFTLSRIVEGFSLENNWILFINILDLPRPLGFKWN